MVMSPFGAGVAWGLVLGACWQVMLMAVGGLAQLANVVCSTQDVMWCNVVHLPYIWPEQGRLCHVWHGIREVGGVYYARSIKGSSRAWGRGLSAPS